MQTINGLKCAQIETPLGSMLAIGDEQGLYLLQFTDMQDLEQEVRQIMNKTESEITKGMTSSILSIAEELNAYFEGKLQAFKTPLILFGTTFQQQAWHALCQIPYGQTKSYREQASDIGKPRAYRAVANANGANHFVIAIPCHRIITSSGKMGGFSAGIHRKKWLLEHERSAIKYLI